MTISLDKMQASMSSDQFLVDIEDFKNQLDSELVSKAADTFFEHPCQCLNFLTFTVHSSAH